MNVQKRSFGGYSFSDGEINISLSNRVELSGINFY